MKPIMQTTFYSEENGEAKTRGNCFVACVASILEFPIEAVPDWPRLSFHKSNWKLDLMTWLNCYGLQIETFARKSPGAPIPHNLRKPDVGGWIHLDGGKGKFKIEEPDYYIVSGPSPRFPDKIWHSCIWYNGEIVHDPHPDGTGLVEPRQWQLISKIQYF